MSTTLTPVPAPALSDRMKSASFEILLPREPTPRLVVCSEAPEKKGKSWFAFSAPGPIGAISTDTGTLEAAQSWVNRGKSVALTSLRPTKDLDKSDADKEWKKLKDAFLAVVDSPVYRTLVIDTATEVWELLRMAEFGKLVQVMPHHYVEANSKMKDLIKRSYARPDLNVIWIHKVKKEYKSSKDGKDSWTGKMERSGFSDMPYLTDVNISHYFYSRQVLDDGTPSVDGPHQQKVFAAHVLDSRYEPQRTTGVTLESVFGHAADPDLNMCDFANLGMLMFPKTDEKYWR